MMENTIGETKKKIMYKTVPTTPSEFKNTHKILIGPSLCDSAHVAPKYLQELGGTGIKAVRGSPRKSVLPPKMGELDSS